MPGSWASVNHRSARLGQMDDRQKGRAGYHAMLLGPTRFEVGESDSHQLLYHVPS